MKNFSFAKNLSFTFLSKGIILFSGFIISILYARFLGPQGMGIITSLLVIPQIVVTIGRLGIKRSISRSLGKNLYSENEVFTGTLIIWGFASLLSMAVVAFYYFNVYIDEYPTTVLFILLFIIPFQYFENYSEGIFEANMKIVGLNSLKNMGKFAEIFLILVLIGLLQLDVVGAAMSKVGMYGALSLYSLFYFRKLFKKFKFDFNFEVIKYLITEGAKYAIPFFLLTVIYRVDILFLERMTTASNVGIYTISVSIAQLVWQIPSAINMVLYSTTLNTDSTEGVINRTTRLLRLILPVILLFGLGMFLFAGIFVGIFYGEDYSEAANIIRILLPGILVVVYSKIIHADVQGQGDPLFVIPPFIVAVITNIILNLILIPMYSIQGAAIASTVSYLLETIIMTYRYHKKYNVKYSKMFILNNQDKKLIKGTINLLKQKINKLRK